MWRAIIYQQGAPDNWFSREAEYLNDLLEDLKRLYREPRRILIFQTSQPEVSIESETWFFEIKEKANH